tara:strand:+ start:1981 stop:2565 length:585 start_codon:yes stop_codon:yes gene_type:complete
VKLEIDILSNPKEFVNEWSLYYDYGNTYLYTDNIKNGFDNYESFLNLFRWKNGIYNISKNKIKVIEKFWGNIDTLKQLKKEFDWEKFEQTFQPQDSSTIWKIFLLHIMNPFKFPIFDVHVFRFHHFITTKNIKEIPSNSTQKYDYYKNHYLPWFTNLRDSYSLDPKKMDESFFKFGQIIKPLKGLPVVLKNKNI